MRIGYFADGPWSHRAFDRLRADHTLQLAFVCARHDNPDPVLRERAHDAGLEFFTHPAINSPEFVARMRGYQCDLFVSMSFNQIFHRELMNLPPLQTINCHAGKLPFYRGRNILNWALINDEKVFGITVHYVDEGIDTGDLILQRCHEITDADTYATLLERAYEGCAPVLYDAIKAIQRGDVKRTPQKSIHPLGFYCPARQPGDERLDWRQSSRAVFNFVRAISRPGPEARTFLGDREIRISQVAYLSDAPNYTHIPGAVVGVEPGALYVKTGDSYVKVTEWSGDVKPRIGDRFI